MRLTFTFLFFLSALSISFAQINGNSPFPAIFEVLAPNSIVGSYDYGTYADDADNPEWGPQLSETVFGDVVWAFDETDSLACNALVNADDVAGKIALIRRGACSFVDKVANAQAAGAIGVIIVNHYDNADETGETVFGMLGGDGSVSSSITIPGVFISRNTGELLAPQLDGGENVVASFTVQSFYDPVTAYSYKTPLSQAIANDVYRINYVNTTDTEVDVTVTATITAPSGATEQLTGSSTVASLADSVILLDGAYTPTELGEYTVAFANSATDEVLTSGFSMTEFTFGLDDGSPTVNAGPADDFFVNTANLRYAFGSLLLTGEMGAVSTYASFGIANAASLVSGDPDADQMTLILYNADPDADGTINYDVNGTDGFDQMTPLALATYQITGNEGADELLYVEWEDLTDGDGMVDLPANGIYYTVVSYDGTEAGLGISPRFLADNNRTYIPFPTSALVLDQNYTGWAGNLVNVANNHLAGFIPPVNTEDLVQLDANKVTIAPNPVSSRLNVLFNLDQNADEVQLVLTDVNGKTIFNNFEANVFNQAIEMDVQRLPAGTYFLSIATPEGYRVERIVKQ